MIWMILKLNSNAKMREKKCYSNITKRKDWNRQKMSCYGTMSGNKLYFLMKNKLTFTENMATYTIVMLG